MPDYAQIAKESRLKVLELVYKAQTSHIGSLFSCADIMAVLSEKIDWDKDKFVLSAGWKACMLYYHLWRKGRITLKQLDSYCQAGSKFIGLAEPIIPELIPIAGGSMGLGICGAVGLALAKKLKGEEGTIYCLMSDGELQIGTTWESAMIAAHHKLDNLVVIVDNNHLQAMGEVEEILSLGDLGMKWAAFSWWSHKIDGHAYQQIESALDNAGKNYPTVIIAETVKGKGVSFMENDNIWHYAQIKDDDYQKAITELCHWI